MNKSENNQNDNFPWNITENYPKAADISDRYLVECEKDARENARSMLQYSTVVPVGMTVVVIGGLIAAQMPYWWHSEFQLSGFLEILGILGISGAFLAFCLEYIKIIPMKFLDSNRDHSDSLEEFWCKISECPNKIDDDAVCKKINVFIRKNRNENIKKYSKIEIEKQKLIKLLVIFQLFGIVFSIIFTGLFLTQTHLPSVSNSIQNSTAAENSSVDEDIPLQAYD